jgi:hypothetical protein
MVKTHYIVILSFHQRQNQVFINVIVRLCFPCGNPMNTIDSTLPLEIKYYWFIINFELPNRIFLIKINENQHDSASPSSYGTEHKCGLRAG